MTFQVNNKPGELISSLKPNAYTEGMTDQIRMPVLMTGNDIISFYIIDRNGAQWCIAQAEIQYFRS